MGVKKISELPAAAALTGSERLAGVQSGGTVGFTVLDVLTASTPASGDVGQGTATAGQTSITLPNSVPTTTPWWVELYIGGVRQRPGVDYTTNGTTTLTLASGMALGETWWVLHIRG